MSCSIMEFQITFWILVVFLFVGIVFNIISFTAPFWNEVGEFHWGLWQMCSENTGCEYVSSEILTDTMQVGRVLISVGFLSHISMIVILAVYKFYKDHIHLLTAACFISFFTLMSLFLGAVFWMSSSNTTFSWCYYLCYMSALMVSASGGIILYVRRYKRLKNTDFQEDEFIH